MSPPPPSRGVPAVFLDRDGVLNEPVVVDGRPYPPASEAELVIVPSAVGACQELREAGLLLVVVTNQPDIARGTVDRQVVDRINDALRERISVDDMLVCPHDDADGCDCRKPAPGLLHRAADRWGIDLRRSVLVGDRWRDIEAGRAAGCATVLVDHGYRERSAQADLVVHTLEEGVSWIIQTTGARRQS